MKTVHLRGYGWNIKLEIDGTGGASLESDLYDQESSSEYVAAINALESLVLAQAAAGINLDTPEFIGAFDAALHKVIDTYD